MLSDLAARRRGLGIQIEQLRAARDEMAASVHGVRDRVDGILAHLDRTDEEARAAAQAVADQFRLARPRCRTTRTSRTRRRGRCRRRGRRPAVGGASGETRRARTAAAPSVDELFARIRAGTASDKGARAGGGAGDAGGRRGRGRRRSGPGAAGQGRRGGVTDGSGAAEDVAADAIEDDSRRTGTEHAVAPGPDDPSSPARRAAGAVTARLSRADQAHPGRRPEPAARPAAQRAVARRSTSSWAPRTSTWRPSPPRRAATWTRRSPPGRSFGGAGAATIPRGDAVEQSSAGLARVDRDRCCGGRWRRGPATRPTGSAPPSGNGGASGWSGWPATQATQAFSAGVAAASADGKVRWVVTTASGCSDCEDNALAGAVSGSEAFPTGHAHPPAHSGCRCLVAPATRLTRTSGRRNCPVPGPWGEVRRTLGSPRAHPQRPDR